MRLHTERQPPASAWRCSRRTTWMPTCRCGCAQNPVCAYVAVLVQSAGPVLSDVLVCPSPARHGTDGDCDSPPPPKWICHEVASPVTFCWKLTEGLSCTLSPTDNGAAHTLISSGPILCGRTERAEASLRAHKAAYMAHAGGGCCQGRHLARGAAQDRHMHLPARQPAQVWPCCQHSRCGSLRQ